MSASPSPGAIALADTAIFVLLPILGAAFGFAIATRIGLAVGFLGFPIFYGLAARGRTGESHYRMGLRA